MRGKPIQTAEHPPASPPVAASAFPYMDAVSSRTSSGLFVEATPTFAPGVCVSVGRVRVCASHTHTYNLRPSFTCIRTQARRPTDADVRAHWAHRCPPLLAAHMAQDALELRHSKPIEHARIVHPVLEFLAPHDEVGRQRVYVVVVEQQHAPLRLGMAAVVRRRDVLLHLVLGVWVLHQRHALDQTRRVSWLQLHAASSILLSFSAPDSSLGGCLWEGGGEGWRSANQGVGAIRIKPRHGCGWQVQCGAARLLPLRLPLPRPFSAVALRRLLPAWGLLSALWS